MEVLERLRIFRSRWIVLVIIMGVGFGAVGYVIRGRQAPVYQASARLLVGGYLTDTRPTIVDIQVANDLTKTYSQLVSSRTVREAAITAYDLHTPDKKPMTPEILATMVKIAPGADAPFIDIIASSTDPELAADVANSLADQLVLSSPVNPSIEARTREAAVLTEINDLTTLRENNRDLVKDVDRRAQDAYTVADIRDLRSERLTLTNNIIQISNTIANLENTLATLQTQTNTIQIIEQAHVPKDAGGTNRMVVAGLGFVVGTMLGSGLLLLADELLPILNSPERIKRLNGLTLLGRVPRAKLPRAASSEWLVTQKKPLSPISDAYHRLYSSLSSVQHTSEIPVYIFTSVRPGEGKSLAASNFAVMLGQAGYKVLIVDAHLNRPVLHAVFGTDESVGGLSKLLESAPDDVAELSDDEFGKAIMSYIHESAASNVFVLPRGKLDDDTKKATLLLRLPQMADWLPLLHTRFGVDAFVFDTAASTVSTEALLLADALEGHTILIMETRNTLRTQGQDVVDQFSRTQSRLAGAALNRQ